MRLFIASPVIIDNYTSIKEDFKDIIEGKWVEKEKLHLTWVFLSTHPTLQETKEKMTALTDLQSELEVAELGYFGTPPRILFAKAQEKVLYEKARELKAAGFEM